MAGNDPFLKKRTGKAETFESNLITQKESCHKQQNAHTSFFGLINCFLADLNVLLSKASKPWKQQNKSTKGQY